jgi:putative oxidoreductase
MKALLLIGRVLLSALFIMAGINYLTAPEFSTAASHGLLYPQWLVTATGALSLLGGLSVALGFKARWGAWLMILCLIPATFVLQKVLALTDPTDPMLRAIVLMKSLSMAGGALLVAYFGSGPWSLDQWRISDRRGIHRREVDRVIALVQTQSYLQRR